MKSALEWIKETPASEKCECEPGLGAEYTCSYCTFMGFVQDIQQDAIEAVTKRLESFGILSMKQVMQEIRALLLEKEAT